MITWMQKHKKYLVVTIWISVIAFVGAGFVGWGEVNLSSSSSWVAKVGDTKISTREYEHEYVRLYEFYNQILGGSLDKEQAKSMGIHEQAMKKLIAKTLVLNFAHDMGIRISDDDVSKAIVNMKEFQVDGKYDDATYRRILRENHFKPVDFERALHDSLMLDKIGALLAPNITELEKMTFGASLFMEDKISLKVIDAKSINPKLTEQEIKSFWQENKNLYQTGKRYSILYSLVKNSDMEIDEEKLQAHYQETKNNYLGLDGGVLSFELARKNVERDYRSVQAQKSALRRYVEYKKGETSAGITHKLTESDSTFGEELLEQLSVAKAGDVLKPIPALDGYVTVKLLEVTESEPLSFQEAKELTRGDLLAKKRREALQERAESELKNFHGNVIGFVKRDDISKLTSLTAQEATEFLRKLFQSKQSRGHVIINDKAILFEIVEQKLPKSEEMVKTDLITQNVTRIKDRLIEEALLEYLSGRYPIVRNL